MVKKTFVGIIDEQEEKAAKAMVQVREAIEQSEKGGSLSMSDIFKTSSGMLTIVSAMNDSIIAAAIHDAEIDKKSKDNKSIAGIRAVDDMITRVSGEKVSIADSLGEQYTELKKAVYDTHVLGVGKNNLEKMETVAKGVGRIATGLLASAFSLAGNAMTLAGNLVKLVPVVGYAMDRVPGLSYTTMSRKQGEYGPELQVKHHNLIEGAGSAFQEVSKKLQKFAYPVHSSKAEMINTVANAVKAPSSKQR